MRTSNFIPTPVRMTAGADIRPFDYGDFLAGRSGRGNWPEVLDRQPFEPVKGLSQDFFWDAPVVRPRPAKRRGPNHNFKKPRQAGLETDSYLDRHGVDRLFSKGSNRGPRRCAAWPANNTGQHEKRFKAATRAPPQDRSRLRTGSFSRASRTTRLVEWFGTG